MMVKEFGNWIYKESSTAASSCNGDYYTYYEGTGASTSKLNSKEMRAFIELASASTNAGYIRTISGRTISSWDDDTSPWYDWPDCSTNNSGAFTYVSGKRWAQMKATLPKLELPTPAERLKDIISSRHAPAIIVPRRGVASAMPIPKDVREQRARETLRRVIGDEKFRNFLKNGFVSVHHRNGKVYQIFPNNGVTRVYDKGVLVERLCVVLQGSFPPTDSLIMRYLMILNDEEHFRSLAIKHSIVMPKNTVKAPIIDKTLAEIFRELKAA